MNHEEKMEVFKQTVLALITGCALGAEMDIPDVIERSLDITTEVESSIRAMSEGPEVEQRLNDELEEEEEEELGYVYSDAEIRPEDLLMDSLDVTEDPEPIEYHETEEIPNEPHTYHITARPSIEGIAEGIAEATARKFGNNEPLNDEHIALMQELRRKAEVKNQKTEPVNPTTSPLNQSPTGVKSKPTYEKGGWDDE